VAKSAQLVNGEIVIDGGDSGIVSVNGTLDASGASSGERGGTVKVLGEKVGLMADARIDASGNAGGGTVLVGGNYQGKGPEANAQYLYMDARAVIDASSAAGDGGRVILWSDLTTRNAGHINVAGARNGGFVEVSSKGMLDFRGTVDLRGLSGRAGELLLDPNDITIGGTDTNITNSANTFGAAGAGASVISLATLYAALGTGAVTVQTASGSGGNGDITIASAIAYSGAASSLTLLADQDIVLNYGISTTNALNVTLNAVRSVQVNANIASAGGNILIKGNVASWATPGSTAPVFGTKVGNFDGVSFASGTSATTTGGGNVWIAGKGGTTGGRGVAFADGSVATTSGTGSIALVGAAVNGIAVDIYQSTPANSLVSGGTVSVVGDDGAGLTANNDGVLLNGAGISAAGNISITGRGGASVGNAVNIANGAQISASGSISLTGNSSNASAVGISFTAGASLTAGSGTSVAIVSNRDVSIGNINTASSTTLAFNVDGAVTQTAPILGSPLLVVGGNGTVTLTNASNDFTTITLNRAGTSTDVTLVTSISPSLQTSTLGTGAFSLTGIGFTQAGGITQDAAGGAVTISGGTGNVTLSQANSFTGAVDVSGGSITVSAAQSATGTGSLSLVATTNVAISANLTTATGDILIKANVNTWSPSYAANAPVFGSATGDFKGVELSGGADITSSGGNIAIAGKGGDGSPGGAPPAGSNQFGVSAGANSTISTTGSGFIVVHGYGGLSPYDNPGSGGSHTGIYLNGAASGTAVDISTGNGQIKLVGTGNSTGGGSGDNNGGVALLFAKVRSTGSGAIDITGTAATTGTGRGVYVGLSGSEVTGATGNVTITGTGGGTATTGYGFYNAGVEIGQSGIVRTTGAGSGNVTLVGYNGSGAGNGILFSSTSPILGDAGMIGNVTLRTDSLGDTSTGLSIAHQAGSGTITFRTDTAPTNLVFNGTGGGLQLTSAILGAISGFGTLAIGDTSHTGTITTGAAYTAPSGRSLSFTTGGNLTVNYALTTAGTGAISLTSAKAIALLGNVTTGGGDIVMMGGNVGPWSSPFTNPTPTYGAATGTFVGVAIGSAIQVTAGAGGNIAIGGRGGDTGGSQYGIQMYTGATVSTSGTGAINMVGRGGGNGDGMAIDGATVSSTGSGAIQMVAIPGTTTGGGFLFSNTVTLGNAAYTGNLTLRSDGAIAGTASIVLPHQSGTGTFTVRTHTDATPIFAATAGAGLEFASSLLSAASSYGGIVVGSATQSGAITMGAHTLANQFTVVGGTAAISIAGAVDLSTYTLSLETGGAVTQSAAITGANGILALGGTGSGAVTLSNGGNDFGRLSLGRTGSTGNVTVSTTADLEIAGTWSTAAMDVTGNSIATNGVLTSSGGSLELNATNNIDVFHNVSTSGGNILLLGNASWATAPTGNPTFNSAAGNFAGVSVVGAAINAGAGGIYIAGAGGDFSGGSQHGVVIGAGASVAASGAIKIYGQGGTSTGNYNSGITIDGGTVSAGAGGLTIVATGGAGAGTLNLGLYAASSGSITGTGGGAMSVAGTGGASSGAGLSLNGASISAAGATTLTLSGDSATSYGIEGYNTASTISTASGALTMTATGDVYLPATAITTASAPLTVTTTANINLTNVGNAIGGTTTINATGSTSTLNFRNTSANQNLNVASTGYLDLYDLTLTGDLTASAVGALTVNTPFGMAAGRHVALTATGVMSNIQISGDVTLSNGNFSAISDRGIAVTANVATGGGDIVMYGQAPGGDVNVGTATGAFHGVRIDGAITVDAGGGTIDIRGRAGNASASHGVTIRNGAGVLTSGIGTMNIMGHGGTSTAGGSAGVEFYAGGAYAQTQNGALTVTGYGSTGVGGDNNPGVALATGEIRATGTGTVDVAGAGGAGGSFGVSVQGGGTTLISTANGNLTVIGNGGTGSGGGFESWGVNVAGQTGLGAIQSTGTGNVSVTGTAGAASGNNRYGVIVGAGGEILASNASGGTLNVVGTGGGGTGTNNHGIYVTGAGATIAANGFNVALNGTGGTGGTGNDGVHLAGGADLHSDTGTLNVTGIGTGGGFGFAATGTLSTIGDGVGLGNIEIAADTMSMSLATLSIESGGTVNLRPVNSSTTIGVGGGAGTLQLPGDMSFVDAALLVIGDGNAGAIAVGAGGLTGFAGTDLGLRGASIALTGDVTVGSVDTLTLYANTGGVTQAAGSTVTAANLVLRGGGDFAVNRAGSGYNNITNVAADVSAGSGSGAIVLYTGAGGISSSNALTDGIGTVNGIATPGGLTWVAFNGLTQTAAGGLSVGGVTNLTAQNGTLDMSAGTNSFGGQIAATSAGGGSILLTASTLALGIVNSDGNVILNATGGSINQAGLLTANGNLNAAATGGPLALSSYQNVVAGSVSLATSGGANNIAWTQSGPMLVGSISSSGQLDLSVTGGGISQVGAISTGGTTILSVDTGNIALTDAANAFAGAITANNSAGGIAIANTGNTLFGNVTSNGVLNVSVTGGALTQMNGTSITTTGNATVTLAGAYALTLTESGNNVGGNLVLSGSTGTLNGTLGGTVTATTGTFLVNGSTIGSAPAPTTNSTAPAPGAGVGGTTVSSALTDAAPISQIQAAAALPPPPPPGAVAVVADSVAVLSGGPGPLLGGGPAGPAGPVAGGSGGPADGGDGGPAVSPAGVVVAPPAPPPAAAAPGAPPPPTASGAPPPPAIVTSSGPPPGPGGPPLVPTTAPPPPAMAVGNVGGASAPAVNGGAMPQPSSTPRTAVSSPFPPL
ncbi:MAG: hypothetical protein ING44_16025, partial [Telmatospirillum sp.]|nr:hypothetical protein [Telmatospirillum sp.]